MINQAKMGSHEITKTQAEKTVPKLALTRQEAATAISASPSTVDRLTQRGLLRPSRATRRPLYSVGEIERFLRETSEQVNADSKGQPAAATPPSGGQKG